MSAADDYPALARLADPPPGTYGTLAPGQQAELRRALQEIDEYRAKETS